MRAALLLCLVTLGCGGRADLRAQPAPDGGLDRVEAALDAGEVDAAREALGAWLAAREGSDSLSARARYLQARLSPEAEAAREEYLWVAVDGASEYAARAWLRLAQLDLMRGEPARALGHLERLRADHPRSAEVGESWLWTGHALEATGELAPACEAWERAARWAADVRDGGLSRSAADARRACEGGGGLRLTVQLGAFRSEPAARRLAERAREADLEARVERVDGLWRVRVGRFGSPASAREAADRVRARDFSAVIVAEEGEG